MKGILFIGFLLVIQRFVWLQQISNCEVKLETATMST